MNLIKIFVIIATILQGLGLLFKFMVILGNEKFDDDLVGYAYASLPFTALFEAVFITLWCNL